MECGDFQTVGSFSRRHKPLMIVFGSRVGREVEGIGPRQANRRLWRIDRCEDDIFALFARLYSN